MTPGPQVFPRRALASWALYDFANSGFAASILAAVYNVYFVQKVVPPEGLFFLGRPWRGPALWAFAVSLSTLAIFLLSPLLGAIADLSGRKQRFLRFFWLLGSLSTAALFFVAPGRVLPGVLIFALANIGFAGGNVFYNAFLPALAPPERQGRVSGLGWAVGYLGSLLCLGLNLVMIEQPGLFGLGTGNALPVRTALLSVGVWWADFGWPIFVWGPPDRPAARRPLREWTRLGWARLADTGRNLGRYKNLALFMAAFALYNDGIETVILTASVVGAGILGMSPGELIQCFLMIQAVAFLGALIFGQLADRWSHKGTILVTLAVYLWVLARAYVMTSRREFWILGAVLGLILGGSQAASRSLMSRLTPPGKSGEFFAFYGIVAKFTAVLGPFVFGIASQTVGLRGAILSLAPFFVLGGLLLMRVREPSGRPPAD